MSDFENVGIVEMAPSGKSLRIILNDVPYTTFTHTFYFSVKNTELLLKGHKKNVTVVMVKPHMRDAIAAKNPYL